MMPPKEKAEELLSKMNVIHYTNLGGRNINSKGLPVSMHDDQIKQCAINAVDEILSMGIFSSSGDWEMAKPYWLEVKEELENK